jgi:2-methylisocitrate lyase-like PEP mutase family enzyme
MATSAAGKLRELLRKDICIQLPGCHDAMGAKLIQEAGFECAYLSGFALSATRLAAPDIGLATYNDMVDAARACCEAVRIPIIGDGDTGYGGVLNVRRTVHGYARAGLAAISIEDQTFPKRCSYASGVQIETQPLALDRIRAAILARDELREREGLV